MAKRAAGGDPDGQAEPDRWQEADVIEAPSRRDRVRASTIQEIKQTARRLLVSHGSEAVSLRAIAREMGMTAPALYRYFDSHEELLRHVVADIFTELAAELREKIDAAAGAASGAPGLEPMAAKLIAGCRAFRGWALAHRPEFSMIFGSPLPGLEMVHGDPVMECGLQFGQVFLDLFSELWLRRPFDVQEADEINPALRPQLERYRDMVGSDLPIGAMQTFLRCWVLLYGMVCLEVFGHLRFALEDPSPMFELMLSDMALMLGLNSPLQR
jgi:AcrR family transcriptional regulator